MFGPVGEIHVAMGDFINGLLDGVRGRDDAVNCIDQTVAGVRNRRNETVVIALLNCDDTR